MSELLTAQGLGVVVSERSTLIVDLSFRDSSNALVTPTSAKWSLYDENGGVINSRLDVTLTVSGGRAAITLTDNDLACGSAIVTRAIVVDALYNSAQYGNNLRLTQEFRFSISPIEGLTA